MRNWLAVGVRERQRDATPFRKEELCCPQFLPIKSITMKGSSLPISEATNVERTAGEEKNKGNIFG